MLRFGVSSGATPAPALPSYSRFAETDPALAIQSFSAHPVPFRPHRCLRWELDDVRGLYCRLVCAHYGQLTTRDGSP